ncbi:uncharacterized protein LOC112906446, partial [Agrilus planipennis]|uniref:Uncharacterized protein LOC112906446 n=1 Tax=Agrilus planipennis TaxID=224129 RepID=A0A7F5RK45_AGRPL
MSNCCGAGKSDKETEFITVEYTEKNTGESSSNQVTEVDNITIQRTINVGNNSENKNKIAIVRKELGTWELHCDIENPHKDDFVGLCWTEAKLKEGIFVGPDIRKLMLDTNFEATMSTKEKEAWISFREVVKKFLGN